MADWFDANLVSILNGFAIGSLLFILAVGLSIVFGMMDVLNLAHGALYLVGAYLAYSLLDGGATWGAFLGALGLAVAFGLVAGGTLSVMTEPLAKRPILDQALLTLGISLIVAEVLSIIYGNDVYRIGAPPGLDGSVSVAGNTYPLYRLVLIGIGLVLAVVVWLVMERTSIGALVRAAVADREMVSAMGIDNRKVKIGVLAFGSVLATVAGVLGGPVYGVRPGLDETVLLLALIVVVIGGLGSIKGALIGAMVIGQVDSLGRALLPELASFILFGALALVLVLRPQGLFGPKKVAA
ncbi:branched-chain amino acid ABC transporter permease [Blastococcus sp. TF02A-26]|uniref:branched-chain amino acid ABC transporter permease n=1 Tax=Blastococcus sp. TF02A-26 TaxID=2250577 RepID=UPI000DE9661A|nr:branched-chain amino acid ABC transporter permease [Blastococcus sp. TF02A-26]RBY90811.1 branched-chain amino acid ABC transporter permease [Blastococcus sp. TF02A-26]